MVKILINFENQSKVKFKFLKLFKKIFEIFAKNENLQGEINLDLMLISEEKAQKLALKFKNKDYVPDVLSFPSGLKIQENNLQIHFLGEIFMTPSKIQKQAKDYNHTEIREFSYLFAHSLYHLLGLDHDNDENNKFMHEKVENILKNLEIFR
nr:rRNA maturation RNase YbeY [Mesomycoplasma ovipneumoniae]